MTELIGSINWLAVAIAWLVTAAIGIGWFRPEVFGTPWARSVSAWTGAGVDELLEPPNLPSRLGYWMVAFGVNAIAMAMLLEAVDASSFGDVVLVAILTTVGFAAPLLSWPAIFAGMPVRVLLINTAAFLVMQTASATILIWLS